MNLPELITNKNVNLTNCDREQIHIPGSIQPHGILLVLSLQLEIVQISNNTDNLIGIFPYQLLGKHLSYLLYQEYITAIESCLQEDFEYINPLKILVSNQGKTTTFNGVIHRLQQKYLILELEPFTVKESGFFNFYSLTKSALSKMQQVASLSELSAVIVKEIRRITGFDRVMVYRFATDCSGVVIAEDKPEQLQSFLGLHYPDSDIPKQARHLYTINPLRLIPDVKYKPVAIISHKEVETLRRSVSTETMISPPPLDLSFSVLRSVSPMHIEYLNNMEVAASMSISLIKNNQLWGLIACHHQSTKFVPYEIRTVCEFLGQVMSLELTAKEENENLDEKLYLKSIQNKFIDNVARAQDFLDALVQDRVNLLKLVKAEGAVVCVDGHLTTIGTTPSESQIHDLISWVGDKFENYLFVTDSLPQKYSYAMEFKDVGSGMLALSINRIRNNYVLWFRPEMLKHVNWAGNPQKPILYEADGSFTLFPRKSFEQWQETVRHKSLPWQQYEIDGAIELRSAIVGIVLRKAEELAVINLELERSNNELDAFSYIASHDLKEPLRGIHNYSTFLLEDYSSILSEDGVTKLETLVRLTKRMEDLINSLLHFSRLGRQELNMQLIDFNELVKNVSEVFHMSKGNVSIDIRIPKTLPKIRGDRLLLEEVLTNLIGNGFKYNESSEKWVEVGYLESSSTPNENQVEDSPTQKWTFYIQDNGIGIRAKHLDTIFRIFKRLHAPGKYGGGTGAGLTIVKKIIERHGGNVWVESTYAQGSTFYFTLPR
ncbi:ATP-binding protein [Iningainema tapete]|uniref:histidine kinase n=1 Tax=Iningainema tapete BLCC-T55 TaxID=2748662 RepID=A0A8J7CGA9_9CYAN|nr:ATP-binding protein [Iningainema tapete]MBD2776145.1 GAF domain-containing protein [Iningainema tapete BLCC-T55]